MPASAPHTGYAPVHGLQMYYEIHGAGEPLVLLHGGMTSIDMCFFALLPALAQTRRVIAVEQQAHGHTADIDRPLSFEQMADDTAALLGQLGVERADVFGYSDGGNVALGLAIRHPALVRKFAIAGTNFNNAGLNPGMVEFFEHATADDMGDEMRQAYAAVAPDPAAWPTLIRKVMQQALAFEGWQPEQLRRIQAPGMVITGDDDIVRPEHAVELFRLLPQAHLAVLPMTDHFLRLPDPAWLLGMLREYFDAPTPQHNDPRSNAHTAE